MKPNNFGNHRRKRLFAFILFGAGALVFATQVYAAKNYPDQDSPRFTGNYAVQPPKAIEALTVVSYNIWFAEEIDQALSEIKDIELQKEVDVILLQEMDEVGTKQIAQELQMNYVYFPAAIEPTYDKNFGNAILSRWPIGDPQKIILPHKSLSNRMNRIATRATIRINGADILVYSVHTESIFTLPRFREDQYTAVLDDVSPAAKLVIVGGDFNSFTEANVEKLEEHYKQAGLTRVSTDSGFTLIKYGIGLPSDHIFARGFVVEEMGKSMEATASDHLPIWVTLRLE